MLAHHEWDRAHAACTRLADTEEQGSYREAVRRRLGAQAYAAH